MAGMKWRWVQPVVGLVTVAIAYLWLVPRLADYSEVLPALDGASRGGLALLAIVGAANLLAPAAAQSAALPGLPLRRAVQSDWATTAVTNVVPGGSALAIGLTFAMYRSWRLPTSDTTRALLVTGVWDNAVKLAMPALGLAWLATEQPIDGVLVQGAIVGIVLLVVATVLLAVAVGDQRVAAAVGRGLDAVRERNWTERAGDVRRDTLVLLETRGWWLTLWTIAGHVNLYLLLLLSLRTVGVDAAALSAAGVLVAFAFGRLATAIPLTPGGLGVMEVSLTASLAVVGSADASVVFAAVLLFRFLTYLAPIPLGLISWLLWSGGPESGSSPTAAPDGLPSHS